MTLKKPAGPAHRRRLRALLETSLDSASTAALSGMMKGYAPSNGLKASSGARRTRAHLTRVGGGSSSLAGIDHRLDRMLAHALVKGPMTTGVLSSVFGLAPSLTGR